MISRREVEAGDIASIVSRLKVFLATRKDAWLYRGQMTLIVDGDNNAPRELVDIPEASATATSLLIIWARPPLCWVGATSGGTAAGQGGYRPMQ